MHHTDVSVVELLSMAIGTSPRVVWKLDNLHPVISSQRSISSSISSTSSNNGAGNPDVHIIAVGKVGDESHVVGVETWSKVPSFKHLEWFNLEASRRVEVLWVEVEDAKRLVRVLESLNGIAASAAAYHYDVQESLVPAFAVTLSEREITMRHDPTRAVFTLPVRILDARWAQETFKEPLVSKPRASIRLASGLDQIDAVLRRIERWRETWSVDVLSVRAFPSVNNAGTAAHDGGSLQHLTWTSRLVVRGL